MAQVVMALRCNWCSQPKHPTRLMHLSSGQLMCDHCYERHMQMAEVLANDIPKGCKLCGLSLEALNNLAGRATTRMYVIPIDGIYAAACATCKDIYCAKRADLYKGTAFGQEMKL